MFGCEMFQVGDANSSLGYKNLQLRINGHCFFLDTELTQMFLILHEKKARVRIICTSHQPLFHDLETCINGPGIQHRHNVSIKKWIPEIEGELCRVQAF